MNVKIEWRPEMAGDRPLWWNGTVNLGGKERRLTLHQQREQPEYFLLFRGDNGDALITGPGTLDDAKAFAERWAQTVCLACYASGFATGYAVDPESGHVGPCKACARAGRNGGTP